MKKAYTAMDLAGRALYATVYAIEEQKNGFDPTTMYNAAHFYLDGLKQMEPVQFARVIRDIEHKLAEVTPRSMTTL